MKKILSLLTLSLLFGLSVSYAQNQRIAVLECFTSTTCGPCASANPALDNLINNNTDKLIAIKYHVNWPSPGDPMNLHNPSEVSSRVSYYGINAVPWSVGDGTWLGNSSSVSQNMINQWAAVDSPVDMRMTHYLNDTQDTIFVVVMGRATSAVDYSGLRLRVAVLEKTMQYATAPGSNGEKVFHNVMKKMLPNAAGTSVGAMQAGDYFAYKFSWALANVMDINELTAVAWLQDNSSKEVIQGCKSADNIQPFYAKQASIVGTDHMKKKICSGSITPDIFVDNLGSETINSLDINVKVNNEYLTTITWNGNIEFGRSAKISLGELNFEVAAENNIDFEIAAINGAPDDYQASVLSSKIEEAVMTVNKSFKLNIRTDDNPQSTTWDIVNTTTGEVILSGGPYNEANHMYTENFDLDGDGCYMFTIYDADGDGLTGSGLYGMKGGSTTLFSGAEFTDKESNEFSFERYQDVAEISANTVNIYPNPSHGMVTVETESSCQLTVYNTTGQMVYNQAVDGQTIVNLANLEKGTYLFVITSENGDSNKQIIVLQ